jgi:hypothetical protein
MKVVHGFKKTLNLMHQQQIKDNFQLAQYNLFKKPLKQLEVAFSLAIKVTIIALNLKESNK